MATVRSILTSAQNAVRDPNGIDLDSTLGLSLINDCLAMIHKTLINVESTLVRGHGYVQTAADTRQYEVKTALGGDTGITCAGILSDGVWKDDTERPLRRVILEDLVPMGYDPEDTGEPSRWYPYGALEQIGFHPVPDDEYDYHVYYWKALESVTGPNSTVPYYYFDMAIQKYVEAEYLDGIEADSSRAWAKYTAFWDQAMQRVFDHGVTRRRASSEMFDVDGV